MHPQMGIPILYHHQLNVIPEQIVEIKENMEEESQKH